MKLFLACTPGLERPLEAEAKELGFTTFAVPGGVEAEGPAGSHETANLWLRCASRVWVRVAEVNTSEELRKLALDKFIPKGAELTVDGPDRWRHALPRPAPKPGAPAASVMLRDHDGRCVVSVDSSGELLHVRGYRQEIGKAPLRETLAAGMLRLSGYTGDAPLWDVMCGSGTLLIEAAWIAQGRAPGANRSFALESWPSHDEQRFKAKPRQQARSASSIRGSDLNAGALGVARRNARRAGVFEALKLERLDATKLPPTPGPGLVVANLPYGIRVGEKSELGDLYAGLGASLKKATPGWRFGFLLQEGEERLGLKIESTFALNNGGLHCRLVTGQV
jgi:putative N6-adenine-specific DNA methylase